MPFGTNEEIMCPRSITSSYSHLHEKSIGPSGKGSALFCTFEDINYSVTTWAFSRAVLCIILCAVWDTEKYNIHL